MGDPSTVNKLIQQGIAAFKAGRKDEARALFMRAVELDQRSEQGWLWLSAVVDSLEEQRICLENVLAINPDNQRAKKGLQVIAGRMAQHTAKPTPPHHEPPTKETPQQPGPTPAFTDFSPDDLGLTGSELPDWGSQQPGEDAWNAIFGDMSPPGSDEYQVPTSVDWGPGPDEPAYPGSGEQVELPSQEEFDDWLASLNLGTANESAAFTAPPDVLSQPAEGEELPKRAPIGAFDVQPPSQGPFVGGDAEVFTEPPDSAYQAPAPPHEPTTTAETSSPFTTGEFQSPVEEVAEEESEPPVEEERPLTEEETRELFACIPDEIDVPKTSRKATQRHREGGLTGTIRAWLAALTLNAEAAYRGERLYGTLSRTLLMLSIAYALATIIIALGVVICGDGLVRLLDPYGKAGLDTGGILVGLLTAMPISMGGFFLGALVVNAVAAKMGSRTPYLEQTFVLAVAFAPMVVTNAIVLTVLMTLTVFTAGDALSPAETPMFLPDLIGAAIVVLYDLVVLSRAIGYAHRFDWGVSGVVAMLGIATLAAPMVAIGCVLSFLLLPPPF